MNIHSVSQPAVLVNGVAGPAQLWISSTGGLSPPDPAGPHGGFSRGGGGESPHVLKSRSPASQEHFPFVIALGHQSIHREQLSKSLILGPSREARSKSVSFGEPIFSPDRTSRGAA
jgi:hypothetical protein